MLPAISTGRVSAYATQDVESIGAGEICAMFGVECSTGDTFNDGTTTYSMVSYRRSQAWICLDADRDW